MEREIERLRERGPVPRDTVIEDLIRNIRSAQQALDRKPHVIKYGSVPWTQGWMAYAKMFHVPTHFTQAPGTWNAPLYYFCFAEQIVSPGRRSGKHRHYAEAVFYIMEGRGYEVHDEKRYEWEAGDVMCVPTYCVHQHFAYPDAGARMFFAFPRFIDFLGLGDCEQMEVHPAAEVSEKDRDLMGADLELASRLAALNEVTQFNGQVETSYDRYVKRLADDVAWRLTCPHVVKGRERPWEDTRMGRLKYLINDTVPSGMRTCDAFLQEIPPGGRSGKHRHVAEELHKVLSGRGYDIHNGVQWDWEAEDVVVIPSHTVHQHFNTDPKRSAVFLSFMPRLHSFFGHGGIEHLEDAP